MCGCVHVITYCNVTILLQATSSSLIYSTSGACKVNTIHVHVHHCTCGHVRFIKTCMYITCTCTCTCECEFEFTIIALKVHLYVFNAWFMVYNYSTPWKKYDISVIGTDYSIE